MSRKMSEETVCDIGGEVGPVESVTITWRGRTYVLDVCGKHAKDVEKLTSKGSTGPPRHSPSERAHLPRHQVIPID